MKIILFISHDASRTGAPILLLNFLKWFKQNSPLPFKVLLGRGGPLESEFAALAPTLRLDSSFHRSIPQKILSRFGWHRSTNPLEQWLAQDEVGLVYSNTITNHKALTAVSFLKCPIISHIHELEYIIQFMAGQQFAVTQAATTCYIAAANAVKTNLVTNHHIPSDRIEVVHAFLPIAEIQPQNLARSDEIRLRLGIPPQSFVVGASGTFGWRKGPDLLVQLARIVRHQYPELPIHFVWVGGEAEAKNRQFFELQYDIQKLGLEATVHFVGATPNPLDYFAMFDVLAMLSREDPYPIVCLEAALLEKPILCFAGSGGEPEFVEEDCGFVVPYLDLETMAAKIHLLSSSPDLRHALGQRAAQKVKERHDIAIAAAQISRIIARFL